MISVSFHPEAEAEFVAAATYYEQCESGLGSDFIDEVEATILHIQDFPDAWPLLSKDIHRCLVNRFPFGIVYSMDSKKYSFLRSCTCIVSQAIGKHEPNRNKIMTAPPQIVYYFLLYTF